MRHDSTRTTVHFKAYRVPSRCWRCWKRFEFFAPYDFVDMLIFRCDRCSEMRASGFGESGEAKSKYLDVHFPALRGWGGKKEDRVFSAVFENGWAEACPCSGRFRLAPPIRCPHCRTPECRLLRGRSEIVESPPIPVLKFTIPPEYANAPARPLWQPKAKA